MEEQGETKRQKKVIPFPNLNARLLEQGVEALKNKDFGQARLFFEQLYQAEPENSQAAYGLAVTYVELERYHQAEELTEDMMKKGIGDFYDVLKLHVTILIQQHRYQKVLTTLTAILSEDSPPQHIRDTLQQLADFAEIRLEEGVEIQEVKEGELPAFLVDIKPDLESSHAERQWRGIQKGKQFMTEQVIADYLDYLNSQTGDPFLKSIVIKLLNENDYDQPFTVYKFGQKFPVDLKASNLFYEGFSRNVESLLEDALESENPSLLAVATQIWNHFTITVYPRSLEPNDPNVWAAACFVFSHQINEFDVNKGLLEEVFHVTSVDLARPLSLLKSVEEKRNPYDFN
ncbi:MAG TPA: tetratricopeptide repeat protein [Candidatus Angelobacter sp.]|nr:tetratricopeptide repeat protein [Candidatus Angelobacter sp.]